MKINNKIIGCWETCRYELSRHSEAEKICFEWVLENAERFGQLQLDDMIRALKAVLCAAYSNGVKETVTVTKWTGGTIPGSGGAVDHYRMVILNSKKREVMVVSEPIGTDLNRHKLVSTDKKEPWHEGVEEQRRLERLLDQF